MSKIKDAKIEKVAEIKEKISNAGSILLIDYKGITVAQDTELRTAFRASGVHYEVLKNRLINIALKDLGYTGDFEASLNGPTAVAFGAEDLGAPAKIILDKIKTFKKLSMKCGFVEGSFLDEEGCKSLSTMPSKAGLISQVLGLLQSPIAQFARAISAIAEKKAEVEA